MDVLSLLESLDFTSLLFLFWFTALIEIPRYLVGALVAPVSLLWPEERRPLDPSLWISVVLVGHNEERSLRACVESLGEQTILSQCAGVQIVVVDDGSTDRMYEVASALRRDGKVSNVLRVAQRGGKSAGVNLALSVCRAEVVVICDIDTTLDRDALAELVRPFADPRVGAVSGNLGVRNTQASLMTRFQQVEYAIGLSLGRCIADSLGTLAVVSGAFGAFRRAAIEGVGGQDVEVGEDADLTMKLRSAGWKLRFAFKARAMTDVPESVPAFIAQRLRWDRGLITIWSRKFRWVLDPRKSTFRLSDAVTVLDIVFFQIILQAVFPIYLIWLVYYFGSFAATILAATLVGYAMLDVVTFAAATAVGVRTPLWLVVFLPLYTVLQISVVRVVRLVAIVQELIFRRLIPRPLRAAARHEASGDHIVRYLKVRSHGQPLENEPRSNRLMFIRVLYLGAVLALGLWLGNFLLGDRIYLRSEGLVLGEPAMAAAEYAVTVRDITVKDGQIVKAGDQIAVVRLAGRGGDHRAVDFGRHLAGGSRERAAHPQGGHWRDDAVCPASSAIRQRRPQAIRDADRPGLSVAQPARRRAGERVSRGPGLRGDAGRRTCDRKRVAQPQHGTHRGTLGHRRAAQELRRWRGACADRRHRHQGCRDQGIGRARGRAADRASAEPTGSCSPMCRRVCCTACRRATRSRSRRACTPAAGSSRASSRSLQRCRANSSAPSRRSSASRWCVSHSCRAKVFRRCFRRSRSAVPRRRNGSARSSPRRCRSFGRA